MADRRAARQLLESSRVEWRRDFDAVAIGALLGFLLGVLVTVTIGLAVREAMDPRPLVPADKTQEGR